MSSRPTVVLIHGLFGFRKLLWSEYFQGVRPLLESMGMRVIAPRLPWAGSVEARGNSLARQLQQEAGALHLVAHSMGGIDARFWISRLGGGEKVASLTTLASPHHGSSAADHICRHISPFRIFAGIRCLTMKKMAHFNSTTPDQPHIIYRSYTAKRPLHEQPWIVRRYGRCIQQHEGDNDSQVSVTSGQWGDHIATLPCDHFELIRRNFWFNPFRKRTPFDMLPVYRDIGEWIKAESAAKKERACL
ncbi:triacylglycerol lipase [Mariprofundus ferrinatatus]|uniref:Triacylglycerol lipase n=1 Tax=Mariprofundus ferrinatatus TaxID=1921087 RepID=A0A2K8L853_9PROT|nr:alpha/beta fold hydrolase [Mariprofundus ferrinatatus]ATX82429.1 triacylglycerol lipase [Mariprofundus ferrinatatus]